MVVRNRHKVGQQTTDSSRGEVTPLTNKDEIAKAQIYGAAGSSKTKTRFVLLGLMKNIPD